MKTKQRHLKTHEREMQYTDNITDWKSGQRITIGTDGYDVFKKQVTTVEDDDGEYNMRYCWVLLRGWLKVDAMEYFADEMNVELKE